MRHGSGSAGISPRRIRQMVRKSALLAFWLAICPLPVVLRAGEQSLEPLELLKQLHTITLDTHQVYAIRDAHLTRGRMDLYLNRGFIAFMTPVNGEITGAVFTGEGEVLMIPPDRTEKRSLAQFTQAPILEEKVDAIIMRFTGKTAQELLAAAHKPDPDDPEQPPTFAEERSALPLDSETSVRILADLLGDPNRPYFFARVSGQELGVFDVIDDERSEEPFSIGSVRKVGSQTFSDVWCSFATQKSSANSPVSRNVTARALSYGLDIRIHPDHSMEGRAEIQLESRSAQDRVISFGLSRWLAVTEVDDDLGHKITVLDRQPSDDPPGTARAYDHVEVVLPHSYPVGERFRLIFRYHGAVITDVGNGVLYVGRGEAGTLTLILAWPAITT